MANKKQKTLRVKTVADYGRSQLKRALDRALSKGGIAAFGNLLPPDTATDLAGIPTFGGLWKAYTDTFPAGVDPLTFVTVTDRIWHGKAKKDAALRAAQSERWERVDSFLESERAEAKAAKAAKAPSASATSRRDELIAAMTAARCTRKQINAALAEAKLPGLDEVPVAKTA